MTDFLTRLAERSVGVGELVQPRPASLFEPRGAVEAPPLTDELEVAEERIAPPPRATAARHRGDAPPPAERTRAAPADEQTHPSEEIPVAAGRPVAAVQTDEPSEPGAARPAAGAPAARSPVDGPRHRATPAPALEPTVEHGVPAMPPEGTAVVVPRAPAGSRPWADPQPERRDRGAVGAPVQADAAPPVRVSPDELEPAAAALSSPDSGVPETPLAPPAPAPRPAPTPNPEPAVVHVTIGRVDVRAVLPAPPPGRPAPRRRPRMTLDDYLGTERQR